MENTDKYPGLASFRQFCKDVAKGLRKTSHTVHTTCAREVMDIMDAATKMPAWFKTHHGITASFGGGSSDVVRKGFTFRAADNVFTVLPPSTKPQKKGVAQTSIEAYHQIDTRKQAGKVAMAAIELTRKHGRVNDRMVANYTDLECARVSARRIDSLEPVQGYVLDGKAYYFKQMGVDVCPTTEKRVQWWAMLPAEAEQMTMNF